MKHFFVFTKYGWITIIITTLQELLFFKIIKSFDFNNPTDLFLSLILTIFTQIPACIGYFEGISKVGAYNLRYERWQKARNTIIKHHLSGAKLSNYIEECFATTCDIEVKKLLLKEFT
jgi:hypothetical protein